MVEDYLDLNLEDLFEKDEADEQCLDSSWNRMLIDVDTSVPHMTSTRDGELEDDALQNLVSEPTKAVSYWKALSHCQLSSRALTQLLLW